MPLIDDLSLRWTGSITDTVKPTDLEEAEQIRRANWVSNRYVSVSIHVARSKFTLQGHVAVIMNRLPCSSKKQKARIAGLL